MAHRGFQGRSSRGLPPEEQRQQRHAGHPSDEANPGERRDVSQAAGLESGTASPSGYSFLSPCQMPEKRNSSGDGRNSRRPGDSAGKEDEFRSKGEVSEKGKSPREAARGSVRIGQPERGRRRSPRGAADSELVHLDCRCLAVTARGKSPDFSGYCSFCKLTRRWFIDGSEKLKTANRAGSTRKSAPRADSSRSSGPFSPKNA